jgi:hypothetical protein
MSHAANPTATDLRDKLIAAKLFTNPPTTQELLIDLDSAIGGAIINFQDQSGFTPFLADSVDSTHYFDGDGSYIVDLDGGFVAITSVSVNSVVGTLNTDYRTMPLNAVAKGRPITYLSFARGFFGRLRPYPAWQGQTAPVSVTGKRGAFVAIPDNAWNAMLSLACISLAADIERLIANGAIKSWKSGTTEEEYNQNPFKSMIAGWQGVVDLALSRSSGNRRSTMGIA